VAGVVVAAAIAVGCGGGGSGSAASFCSDAEALKARFDKLDEGDLSYDTFVQIDNELKKLTPPEAIKADYNKLVDAFDQLVDAMEPLKDVDFSDPSAIDPDLLSDPEVTAAFEKLQTITADDSFTTASDNVDKYLQDECNIDIGS